MACNKNGIMDAVMGEKGERGEGEGKGITGGVDEWWGGDRKRKDGRGMGG